MTHLLLNAAELREKHPLSVAAVRKWIIETSIATAPKEVDMATYRSTLEQGIDDAYIDQALEFGGRILYDFFDTQGVYIGTKPMSGLPSGEMRFQFTITGPEEMTSEGWPGRIEAEEAALKESFRILEKKLENAAA